MTTECDRSFTRSDALAKHMRTVHETEALRPSDPVPKGHSSQQTMATPVPGKGKRGRKSKGAASPDAIEDSDPIFAKSGGLYSVADGFSDDEIKYKPKELYAYLCKKVEVLEEEKRKLEKERDHWRERHKRNYAIKERYLDEKAFGSVEKVQIWKGKSMTTLSTPIQDAEGGEDVDAEAEIEESEVEAGRDEEGDLIMEG